MSDPPAATPPSSGSLPIWIDGEVRDRSAPGLPVDDSSFLDGRGCYSTARVAGGCVRWLDAHLSRLTRDAELLGLPAPPANTLAAAFEESARAAFGSGEGAVRVSLSVDGRQALHVVALPRFLGEEPTHWTAVTAPFPHPGPQPWRGAKVTGQPLYGVARAHAREAHVNEALLCDSEGRAVEGSRSNWLVVDAAGHLSALDLDLGGVRGLALEQLRRAIPMLELRSFPRAELSRARELIAVNALRGARPVISLDGVAIGSGEAGSESERLDAILAAA